MVTLVDDIDSLNLQELIFKDVKYYISGDVSKKIMLLLQAGGAENTKYFGDYVTHLICGQNATDTDLEEAQDIYQIPAVTEHWVLASVRLKKLANTKSYSPSKNKIFAYLVACISKVSAADAKALYALITYHGGRVKLNLDPHCTHLICGSATGKKYKASLSLPPSKLKVVTPDWVIESVKARIQAVAEVFHPKLLIVPQPIKSMEPRISSITGFDFEEGIAKNEVPTQNMSENKDDSTQALLDKLKQRMPWNHPPSSANTPLTPTSATQSVGYTNTVMPTSNVMNKTLQQGVATQNLQIQSGQMMQKFGQNTNVTSQAGMTLQGQQSIYSQNLPQQQQQQQQQQLPQQQTQQQPHGLIATQIQQQKLLHQHQLRMQMLQQKNTQQNQQGFSQQNVAISQMNQNMQPAQMQQHIQTSQHHVQQQSIQTSSSMTSAQQQIENISQMLSQSANNLQQQQQQQQQQQLNQSNMVMKQNFQSASQAVQNIAQHLAQSTQNYREQTLQNAKMNQGLGQGQVINQQQLMGGAGQQMLSGSGQQQSLIQQQTVQTMSGQQQNMNMGVVSQQGLVTSQAQQNQGSQLNQLVSQSGQQTVIGQQIQGVQQTIQGQTSTVQGAWRQQNIQMVQNINQGQHQIVRSPLVQTRNPQNQVILQQQLMQSQQQTLINNQQQSSPQHSIQQPQQIIGSQNQTHHQILVQKQQLLSSGQPQQLLINQHTGQQQILVHGNQQVTVQGNQQIVSQNQILTQGGQQILSQGGQQVLTQGQHVIQQGSQHQVVIAQPSQQIVSQSGQMLHGQGQTGGIQQMISHAGAGQQVVQGQSWQQQQYLQRQQIGQPGAVGPRVSWSGGGRQLIHLDAQTHAQLQQMDPQQRAMFVAQLQKRRQLSMQRAAAAAALQQQQPGVPVSPGSPAAAPQSVTFIRSQLPQGLTPQQQVQWLQQQGARASVPTAAQAQPPQSPVVGSPGGGADTQLQQMQLQRQQQLQRLQQLQTQRDHVAHHHAAVKQQVTQSVTPQLVGASPITETQVDSGLLAPTTPEQSPGAGGAVLVNPKTKTALANMLSIRLQGAAPTPDHEPSAAGTLRLMTAAHTTGGSAGGPGTGPGAGTPGPRPALPARLLLGPAGLHAHAHQGAPVGSKVYTGPVRPAPPRAQFYGHNPNLKLPPDLFLLGCVFHIVEYQSSWGSGRVARWTAALSRRGGEVETSYCARVTHVLCETQRHGVVMQALRDAKRCVTAYWLSDAMSRRCVAPPWQALHLPALYAARDRPARHHRAALSGWRADERHRIIFAVEHVGAKLTPYMTRDNTVLICKRAEGNKYRRAREWGIPVVTCAWLTDLLLGNMSALSQIENAKYQQFNLTNPFRMDYSLVSHLMNAWKMPINITPESHERAKRSAQSGVQRRAKRPRLDLEVPPPPPPSLARAAPPPPPLHLAPRVLFSGMTPRENTRLATIVRQLGGLVVTTAMEATHLVMEKLVRTSKLISCLVTVKHLLTPEWILESQRQCKFADEAKHELRDEAFNKMYKCDISEVLLCGEQRRKLFEGITFFLSPCVKPSRAFLAEVIELCGGRVEKNRRSFVSIQELHTQKPFSYLVLVAPNDLHLVYYLLQAEKTLNVVCSAEVVLSAIMRQKLDVDEFLVQIN